MFVRNRWLHASLTLAVGAGFAFAAEAQTPTSLAGLQACRAIEETSARLSCYDKEVAGLKLAEAAGDIVVIDREQVHKTRKGLFGFTVPKIPFLNGSRGNKEEQAEEAQIETTVTTARSFGYNLWRLTLAEGGTWETTDANARLDPRSGSKILIKRGMLGNYTAKIDEIPQTRVRRVN
jgi:hypothetical protein